MDGWDGSWDGNVFWMEIPLCSDGACVFLLSEFVSSLFCLMHDIRYEPWCWWWVSELGLLTSQSVVIVVFILLDDERKKRTIYHE